MPHAEKTISSLPVQEPLLAWYKSQQRPLPWRRTRDPYRIWLSEMMLQQTQVKTVIAYYERFTHAFPDLSSLASAPEEAVLKAWEGLGYYSRARNLYKTARMIQTQYGGRFPQKPAQLLQLPGIGAYTAGAIASIAFGLAVPAVDGNVIRVCSRLAAMLWTSQKAADRKQVEAWILPAIPADCPGDFNQALMDLGAMICLPGQPLCRQCPLSFHCQARQQDSISSFPLKKQPAKVLDEWRVVLIRTDGEYVHVGKQPESGILAGLYTFDWFSDANQGSGKPKADPKQISIFDQEPDLESIRCQLVCQYPAASLVDLGKHRHTFSHRRWHLQAYLLYEPRLRLSEQATDRTKAAAGWIEAAMLSRLPMARALSVYRERWLAWHDQLSSSERI